MRLQTAQRILYIRADFDSAWNRTYAGVYYSILSLDYSAGDRSYRRGRNSA